LEALFRKLKSLEEVKQGVLAGKIGVVMDLVTRLPVEIWFEENPSVYHCHILDHEDLGMMGTLEMKPQS
jgi:hypothetical protein